MTSNEIEPYRFAVDDQDDLKKLIPWIQEQVEKSKKIQAEKMPDTPEPFRFGAIGGLFSYIFTPTNIGTLITVKCGITNEELFLDGGI